MNADMADSSNLVKALLIRAEDMRILGDMQAMRRHYKRLNDVNRCVCVCTCVCVCVRTSVGGHVRCRVSSVSVYVCLFVCMCVYQCRSHSTGMGQWDFGLCAMRHSVYVCVRVGVCVCLSHRDLITEHLKRSTNHTQLLQDLKEVCACVCVCVCVCARVCIEPAC